MVPEYPSLRLLLTLLLTTGVLWTSGCASDAAEPPPADSQPERLVATRGKLVERIILSGELDAAEGAVISVPRLPEWQTSIQWLAAEGTEVREGEVVVELDTSSFTKDLEENRRQEDEARQRLEQAEADAAAERSSRKLDAEAKQVELEQAELEFKIPAELISRNDYQDRELAVVRARSELAKALETLRAHEVSTAATRKNLLIEIETARRARTTAELALAGMKLQTPRSGIFVVADIPWEARKLQVGDTVHVGFVIGRIPDIRSTRVVADLADVDDGTIQVGMPVQVALDAYPERTFSGTIEHIGPIAQEKSRLSMRRTFQVRIDLETIDAGIMRPGLSAKIIVKTGETGDSVLIPRGAIDFSSGKPSVQLARGGKREITVGRCNATHCAVKQGLEEGQELLSRSTGT
ncbi:MAG TPA: efflux RND transporter periplasmic adaptor subunit [Thermoanaerobaculia bacterium]|nr:efflux RND transporter periplasmic adaptor subunit [Thermoanaerobaculia bacterium]